MAYNGFWADFFVQHRRRGGVVRVFVARARRAALSWWGTALLTLVIDAAYLLPVLLLTTAGSALRLLLYPTGRWRWRFCSFTASRGESCSRSRRS